MRIGSSEELTVDLRRTACGPAVAVPSLPNPFDQIAEEFARGSDLANEHGYYRRGELFLELAKATVPPGGTILDYGCGPGRMAMLLAREGFRVRGVDTSEKMIAQAKALDRNGLDLGFELISGSEQILGMGPYDAVVCSSVIEYVPEPWHLLQRLRNVLRPAGALLVSYANKVSLARRYWDLTGAPNPLACPNHQKWSWPGFRTLLVENGFIPHGRPSFYESPFGWTLDHGVFAKLPVIGSLGVIAALRR